MKIDGTENSRLSGDANTEMSPPDRPDVLFGPEQRLARQQIEAALFGGPAAVSYGRYRLLDRLGEGGMGIVYAAYDEHLERKIAIKLIRPSRLASDEARERTLREARALARLSHPNVVHVYEVGELEGQLYVAMEFLAGPTLQAWHKGQIRHWRETLRLFGQAGEGLAGAHAQGIIHRDFKPQNAMLGADGRVRVLDFGLARLGELAGDGEGTGSAAHDEPAGGLTMTGAVLGTPAYMAPEQFKAQRASAHSDQYSFCVALFEALYGHRPFNGATLAELMAESSAGRIAARPRDTQVPIWVHQAVVRGLQADPAGRWPSMRGLLTALERDPGARARRIALAAALLAGVGAVAAGAEGYRRWDVAERVAVCAAKGAEIAAVWNDEARQRLRAAFTATELSYAATSAERAISWLDQAAAALTQAGTDVCLNGDVRGVWDEELMDRALWCLDDRQLAFAALVAELGQANAPTVTKAVNAVASLRPVDACLDESMLRRQPAPPTQGREAIGELRAALSRARSLTLAGNYKDALPLAIQAHERAERLAWLPLVAAAGALEGLVLERTGAYAEAEAASAAAFFEASRSDAWDVAADAATNLILTVGSIGARHAEGRTWAQHAEVALVHEGDPAGLRDAIRLTRLAGVEERAGNYSEALTLNERALATLEQTLGPAHPLVGDTLNGLANVHLSMGAFTAAQALYERALAIQERALGPGNPKLAVVISNLAIPVFSTGQYAEAISLNERALAIREQALGPDHLDVAMSLINLAIVFGSTGANAEALPLFKRGLAIRERALGPNHPDIANALHNLAVTYLALGAFAEARTSGAQALAIQERTLDPNNPVIADTLETVAIAHQSTGAYAEAKRLHIRALAIREQKLGPNHFLVAMSLGHIGEADIMDKRPQDALPLLERAVTIFDAAEGVQPNKQWATFNLARALVATGGDRVRAIALATSARDKMREIDGNVGTNLPEVERWLAEQAAGR